MKIVRVSNYSNQESDYTFYIPFDVGESIILINDANISGWHFISGSCFKVHSLDGDELFNPLRAIHSRLPSDKKFAIFTNIRIGQPAKLRLLQ